MISKEVCSASAAQLTKLNRETRPGISRPSAGFFYALVRSNHLIGGIRMTTGDNGASNIEVVENNVAKWLRASTPAERIQMAGALNEMGRRNLAKSVSEIHPHWS